MKTFYAFLVSLFFIPVMSFAQTWQWTKVEPNGTAYFNSDDAHHVAADASGNVYVLADYNDSLYINGNYITKGNGSYLAKYDSLGNLLWYRLIATNYSPGVNNINATSLVVNANGVFMAGVVNNLSCNLGNTYSIGSSVFSLDTSGCYLYGGQPEFFLCKLNSNGNVVWNKTSKFCAVYGNEGVALTADKKGNLVISGVKLAVKNSQNNQAINFFNFSNDIITDNTGHDPTEKLFVLNYSNAGTFNWSNFATDCGNLGSGSINSLSLGTDSKNSVYVYAQTHDSSYFGANLLFRSVHDSIEPLNVLAKLSSTGQWQFANEVSTFANGQFLNQQKNNLLAIDSADNIYTLVNLYTAYAYPQPYIAGTRVDGIYDAGYTHISPQMYLVKYRSNGALVYFREFGMDHFNDLSGAAENFANGIVYNNGRLYITGRLDPTLNIYTEYPYYYFSNLTVPDQQYDRQNPYTRTPHYFVAQSDLNANFNWATTFWNSYSDIEGLGITANGKDVYTAGFYVGKLEGLGNLNGNFQGETYNGTYNQFIGKLKDQYIRVGQVSATTMCPGTTINIPFTSTGLVFSSNNTFTAEISDSVGYWGNPTAIGSVKSAGNGTITATIPNNFSYGNGYRIRIRSSDTLQTGYNYFAYADTAYKITLLCAAPSSGFAASNITGTTATLSWNAVACGVGYKLQYRKQGTSKWTTINTNTNSSGINSLSINTVYQWRVATKCRNNGITVFSAYSPIQTFATAASLITAAQPAEIVTETGDDFTAQLMPNPASGKTTLVLNSMIYDGSIRITDLAGKTILEIHGVSSNKVILPVSNLSAGLYFVHVQDASHAISLKLVKA